MVPLDAMPIPLASGKGHAWVDPIDVEAVAARNWSQYVTGSRRAKYAHARVAGKTPSLHRFIAGRAGIPARLHVDHVDRDGLNCTRSNLRPATKLQNSGNVDLQINNTTGYRGVYGRPCKRRWTAQIQIHSVARYLGIFETPEAAARVYDAWAREYFGEFARLNLPGDQ